MSQNCFFTVWIIFYHVSFFCFFLSVYIHTISLSILSITLATFVSWIKIYYANSTDNYWPSSTVLRPPNESVFWVKTKISSQDCHVLKVYERVECQELTGRKLSIVFFLFFSQLFSLDRNFPRTLSQIYADDRTYSFGTFTVHGIMVFYTITQCLHTKTRSKINKYVFINITILLTC